MVDKILEAAKAKASKSGKRVKIPERATETTTLYANPDGKTLRMEMHLEPIRVKNANGDGFTPIDTTLVKAVGVIRPKSAKGGLRLSAGGKTTVIKSKSGDITAQIDAPRTLPRLALNGSTATYSSAYGKGIDLVVTVTPTGFRQQIVIRQRPAEPVTFRVPVDLPKGISFGKNTKGQPTLKSDNGKHSLDIRPAALLDAVAADANADLGAVRVGRAQVSLDGSALMYSPDPAFLADPATTFPVTMTAADDDWWDCTLGDCPDGVGESMDTNINDVDLTDSWDMHYRDQMRVGKSYSSSIAKRWRAYIQFPLPRESDPFWNSTIQNADLELWNYLSNDCGEFVGSGITARRVTSDWDHLTLQWNDQPSVSSLGADTEYGAYSPDCSGSMNYEHDLIHSVDTIVQDWANGETNYGFQLRAGDESELRNWRRYRSREQTSGYPAHGPRLVDFEPAERIRVVFETREDPTTFPTYEQAVAWETWTPEETAVQPVTETQARALADHRYDEASTGVTQLLPLGRGEHRGRTRGGRGGRHPSTCHLHLTDRGVGGRSAGRYRVRDVERGDKGHRARGQGRLRRGGQRFAVLVGRGTKRADHGGVHIGTAAFAWCQIHRRGKKRYGYLGQHDGAAFLVLHHRPQGGGSLDLRRRRRQHRGGLVRSGS